MSEKDPQEHPKTYERFCAPRFERLEREIAEVRTCATALKAVVTNGLKDDVAELKEGQRWMFRLVVGILVTVALGSATLYFGVIKKVNTINAEVQRVERTIDE